MFLASVRATPEERKRSLPGDFLIPDAATTVMHAVAIAARPECVRPWLVQMGSGRAGWLSTRKSAIHSPTSRIWLARNFRR